MSAAPWPTTLPPPLDADGLAVPAPRVVLVGQVRIGGPCVVVLAAPPTTLALMPLVVGARVRLLVGEAQDPSEAQPPARTAYPLVVHALGYDVAGDGSGIVLRGEPEDVAEMRVRYNQHVRLLVLDPRSTP